ncbi:MAG: hypothetical protein AAF074_17050 [Pseudomonadota bacterium]
MTGEPSLLDRAALELLVALALGVAVLLGWGLHALWTRLERDRAAADRVAEIEALRAMLAAAEEARLAAEAKARSAHDNASGSG